MTKSLAYIGLTALIFCGFAMDASGQLAIHRSNEIPVQINGLNIDQAWAGGLNSSQWSRIDVNIDGHEDLFIFDRTSDQIQIYIQDPATGDYSISFDYQSAFPSIKHWALLRDFNCDGRTDIFTSTPGGIAIYENTSINDQLSFVLRTSLLQSYYDFGTDPYYSNLYVSSVDIPSIDDFDGDGDLDIHTFTQQGTTIEYHQNQASQIGDCDSLAFVLANRCYGFIAEDAVSPTIYIGEDLPENWCSYNVGDPGDIIDGPAVVRHAGSSICTFDYDGNGRKDLLIGDITARDISLVYIDDRGEMLDSAFAVEPNFPQDVSPIDMHVFHTGYHEDLDNDGIKDLVITPSNGTESEDQESCYLYKNIGSNEDVDLELVSRAFMQEEMIDIGTVSIPRLVDYNVDGKQDLIISNRGKFQDGGEYFEEVWLFENTGNANYPIYSLVTQNAFGLNSLGLGDHLALTFGDIDDDGDSDMVVGNGTGQTYFFENTAGPGNNLAFDAGYEPWTVDGEVEDLGANLIPQLFDLDEDGLLDLIIGERNGNMNYLHNQGSASAYDFVLVDDSLGGIITDIDLNLIGYNNPWLYRDIDGDTHAMIGGESGYLMYVETVTADTSTWVVTDSLALGIFNGERSSPIVSDLDNDGQLDIINGNLSGGLGLYMGGEEPSSLFEENQGSAFPYQLYPNPTEHSIVIESDNQVRIDRLSIYDISGRLALEAQPRTLGAVLLDTSVLDAGLYTIRISSGKRIHAAQFIKK